MEKVANHIFSSFIDHIIHRAIHLNKICTTRKSRRNYPVVASVVYYLHSLFLSFLTVLYFGILS